jgi:hypothetical protein
MSRDSSISRDVDSQVEPQTCPGRSEPFKCRGGGNHMRSVLQPFQEFVQCDNDRSDRKVVLQDPFILILGSNGTPSTHISDLSTGNQQTSLVALSLFEIGNCNSERGSHAVTSTGGATELLHRVHPNVFLRDRAWLAIQDLGKFCFSS